MPTAEPGRGWRIAAACGATAAAVAGVAVLWQFDPNVAGNPYPACPFYWLTGLYCPGCGSTRALHALVHGDIARAWTLNPLLVAILPLLPALSARAFGWQPAKLQRAWPVLESPRGWLAVLLGYGVLRNLPWPLFAWMAP